MATLLILLMGQLGPIQQVPPGNAAPLIVQTPDDACILAAKDLASIPEALRLSTRYVWIHNADPKTAKAIAVTGYLALQKGSRTVEPVVCGGGYLVRLDLSRYAPNPDDLARLLTVWDKGMGFNLDRPEPWFHEVAQADPGLPTVSIDTEVKDQNKTIAVIPAGAVVKIKDRDEKWTLVEVDGKQGFIATENIIDATDSTPIVQFARHLEPTAINSLKEMTGSTVPIVEARWFISIALSSVDGGQYYDLAFIDDKPSKGTALESFIAKAGADFDQIQRKANRAAMISKVTAKWRRVEAFYGDLRRPENGPALVTLTYDPRDNRREGSSHPPRS